MIFVTIIFVLLISIISYIKIRGKHVKEHIKEDVDNEVSVTNKNENIVKHKDHKKERKQKKKELLTTADKYVYYGKNVPTNIAFSFDNKYFLVCFSNRRQSMYKIDPFGDKTGHASTFSLTSGSISDIFFLNRTDRYEVVVSVPGSRSIKSFIIDVDTGNISSGSIDIVNAVKYDIRHMRIANDSSWIVLFGDESLFFLYTAQGELVHKYEYKQLQYFNMDTSHDSNFFSIASSSSSLLAFGTCKTKNNGSMTFKKAFLAGKHQKNICSMCFHPFQNLLATCDVSGVVQIHNTPKFWEEGDDTTKMISEFNVGEEVKMAKFNPISSDIAILLSSDKLLIYDVQGTVKKTIENPHPSHIDFMNYTYDGGLLVFTSSSSSYSYAYQV